MFVVVVVVAVLFAGGVIMTRRMYEYVSFVGVTIRFTIIILGSEAGPFRQQDHKKDQPPDLKKERKKKGKTSDLSGTTNGTYGGAYVTCSSHRVTFLPSLFYVRAVL